MSVADRPNKLPWPPILFLGALLSANGLSRLFPVSTGLGGPLTLTIGALIFAGSIGSMLWAFASFRAHNTTVLPHKRSDVLIDTGPFRFSRNPIYLAEAVLLAGLGLINGSIWYFLVLAPFVWAVTTLAIVREEAHLASRFGQEWDAYALRVRRWL